MSVCQKSGVILESKVVQKLSSERKILLKNGLPSKIDFESTILALFDEL